MNTNYRTIVRRRVWIVIPVLRNRVTSRKLVSTTAQTRTSLFHSLQLFEKKKRSLGPYPYTNEALSTIIRTTAYISCHTSTHQSTTNQKWTVELFLQIVASRYFCKSTEDMIRSTPLRQATLAFQRQSGSCTVKLERVTKQKIGESRGYSNIQTKLV